ncbi:MAG: SEL1-like repeat protein [Lachnospiraceae bacterium]|nr:SEL1-like repeat protein [Lachnospiraceae bacterium]
MGYMENKEEADRLFDEGCDYLLGNNGVSQDEEKANELFRKAVDLGHPVAAYNLAQNRFDYALDTDDWEDFAEAFRLYEFAVENSDDDRIIGTSENKMYKLYINGKGVNRDVNKALEHLSRAAEHGHTLAQVDLGSRYIYGNDVIQDIAKGREYMQLAANAGNPDACKNMGLMYHKGDCGIQRNVPKAVEYYTRAAEQGNGDAMIKLANIYLDGDEGVDPDQAEALTYIRKLAAMGEESCIGYLQNHGVTDMEANKETVDTFYAAEHGDPDAMCEVGRFFDEGEIMPEDDDRAYFWYSKAAERGHAEAKLRLALYLEYHDNYKNPALAMQMLTEAVEQGEDYANYEIGKMYSEGNGVPVDINKAMEHLNRAVNSGYGVAAYQISHIVTDPGAKKEWLQKAADMGYEKAQQELMSSRSEPKKKGFFGLF